MKNLSAKNNEEKNDFSASLRPFGTHNSRYLQGLRHILLRYRYGERQISANVSGHCKTINSKVWLITKCLTVFWNKQKRETRTKKIINNWKLRNNGEYWINQIYWCRFINLVYWLFSLLWDLHCYSCRFCSWLKVVWCFFMGFIGKLDGYSIYWFILSMVTKI